MSEPVRNASLHHLLGRLAVVEERARALVAARRAVDPETDDAFRGLYVSDALADRLLSEPPVAAPSAAGRALFVRVEAEGDAAEAAGAELRLRTLTATFGLSPFDVEILLIALAVDLDPRFERLYGYLNDDVSRRRPTAGLALDLCGAPTASAAARSHFGEDGVLVRNSLVAIEEGDRPFLTRTLRVPDRVTAHLLGDELPDALLRPVLVSVGDRAASGASELGAALAAGVRSCYVRELRGGSARATAHDALLGLGRTPLSIDLDGLEATADVPAIARAAVREAALLDATLVVGPIDRLAGEGFTRIRPFLAGDRPVVLTGAIRWDPAWIRTAPYLVETAPLTETDRSALWGAALDEHLLPGLDLTRETAQFRLSAEQILRAADSAHVRARAADGALTRGDLAEACREQSSAGLERLAVRMQPRVGWSDLVVGDDVRTLLEQISSRARLRNRVLDEWGMADVAGRRRGVSALFAGPSGTGKTMGAEVIARDLGLDLYRIDLATVVDKYIGETEKNLGRIFDEAEGVSGVLLFDEADALFGRRSEVKDSHDRYANIEVAYLLQRMESFDGVAILATNMRANLDEAFIRRLDIIVDFPLPDEAARRRIWERSIAPSVPRANDIDFGMLAHAFDISGGDIRNVCLAAVYSASEEDRPLTMGDLLGSTEREYRKLGRLGFERSMRA